MDLLGTVLTGIIVIMVILDAIMIYRVRKQQRTLGLLEATEYIVEEFGKLYFCSYDLWTVHVYNFFPRYRKFVDYGFCAPVAAMSMLALRGNRETRMVFAHAGKNHFIHAWVEFCWNHHWYVIDPTWHYPFILVKEEYYHENQPEIIQVFDYDEFWGMPIAGEFFEKMSHPETSWLIWELMLSYGFDDRSDPVQILNPKIKELRLGNDAGKHISMDLFYRYPEIIISRRIIHQMMQKPNRTRPKAHTIRHVQSFQRLVKREFLQWLKENYPEEYEQEVAVTKEGSD